MNAARAEATAYLRALGDAADEPIDLARAALALAALERPRAAPARYRAHAERLAREAAAAAAGAPSLESRLAALAMVLFERHGYDGDGQTYDDLANANLMSVIDRRRGLPIALGILYIHAARAQGCGAAGLDFPAHFLVRVEGSGARAVVDPFHRGRRMDAAGLRALLKQVAGSGAELAPAHWRAMSDRAVLLRLQNNLKIRHLRAGRLEAAAAVVETMLLIAPAEAGLWRESGMILARLGQLAAAGRAFEACLARADSDAVRREAAALLQRLRRRLN